MIPSCIISYAFDDADDNVLKHKIRTERPAPIPSFYSRPLAELVDALLDADVGSSRIHAIHHS